MTVRFHDFRYTFQTLLLYYNGGNPLAVEKLIGHKLPPMLERYWHPSPTVLRETVGRLDRIPRLSYPRTRKALLAASRIANTP